MADDDYAATYVDEDVDDVADYDADEVDELLDALLESEDFDDFAERRRRRPRRSHRSKPKPRVTTARGTSQYRAPAATGGAVTQKHLKDALDRVGVDVRRNAQGIKAINSRLTALDNRMSAVASVNALQTRQIAKLQKQMRLDGALELAATITADNQLDAYQLLKGAVKSGFLGEPKGALGNPALIGGLGLFLRNPNILGGLIPRPT